MTNEECIAQLEADGYAVSKPPTPDEMAKRAYNAAYNAVENLHANLLCGGVPFPSTTQFMLRRLRVKVDECIDEEPENER